MRSPRDFRVRRVRAPKYFLTGSHRSLGRSLLIHSRLPDLLKEAKGQTGHTLQVHNTIGQGLRQNYGQRKTDSVERHANHLLPS